MGMPADSSSDKRPSNTDTDSGTRRRRLAQHAPCRGKLFHLLWPVTSYVVTNVTVTLLWLVFFVFNRTMVIGRRNVGEEPNTLLLSNHQSMLDSFLVGLAAFYPQSCLKPHLIPWNSAAGDSRRDRRDARGAPHRPLPPADLQAHRRVLRLARGLYGLARDAAYAGAGSGGDRPRDGSDSAPARRAPAPAEARRRGRGRGTGVIGGSAERGELRGCQTLAKRGPAPT